MKVRYTVPSDQSRVGYSTNGSTTVFSVPFVFFDDTDLQVILVNNTTAVETILTLTTNYTVTGGAGTTGSLTTVSTYASGSTLVIQREIPYTQEIDYQANDGFPADVNEEGLDRSTMQVQQVRRRARQTPQLPATYDPESGDISFPMPVSGKTLVANAGATGWDNADLPTAGSDLPTALVGLSNYDLLEYDSASVLWRNRTLATVLKRMLTTAGDIAVNVAGTVSRFAIGTAGQVLGVSGGAISWVTPTVYGYTGVRQTVQHGPVTTAGLPNFLPSTDANLDLGSQNISSSYPFVVSAANGANASGAVNRIGISTANLTWTGLTASRAAATPNFLCVTINADGTLTPGYTILPPIYQWGGTPSTINAQYTFNIAEMKGYLGNGSTAPEVFIVWVGEAATDGSGVISTVAYAYNGRYDSGFTATLPTTSTKTSASHNIGCKPRSYEVIFECTTADGGFAVGEQIKVAQSVWSYDGSVLRPVPVLASVNTMAFTSSSSQAWVSSNAASGASLVYTLASWKYKAIAERGW